MKAIASIGGSNSGPLFETATSGATLNKLVASIVTLVQSVGYDGVDIDWEPLATTADETAVIALANGIKKSSSRARR